MVLFIVLLLTLILSVGGILATFFLVSNRAHPADQDKKTRLLEEIAKNKDTIHGLLKQRKNFRSATQLDSIKKEVSTLKKSVSQEEKTLEELGELLQTAQQNIEQKEVAQQDLKMSGEAEVEKLDALLAVYEEVSTESIDLEQRLAQSMKNLESILNEVSLTEAQRGQLDDLNEAMNIAGTNLRNLILEYEAVNGRLTALKSQHEDLEGEYTRLVEEQLG